MSLFYCLGEVITINKVTLMEAEYNEVCCKGLNRKKHSISDQWKW